MFPTQRWATRPTRPLTPTLEVTSAWANACQLMTCTHTLFPHMRHHPYLSPCTHAQAYTHTRSQGDHIRHQTGSFASVFVQGVTGHRLPRVLQVDCGLPPHCLSRPAPIRGFCGDVVWCTTHCTTSTAMLPPLCFGPGPPDRLVAAASSPTLDTLLSQPVSTIQINTLCHPHLARTASLIITCLCLDARSTFGSNHRQPTPTQSRSTSAARAPLRRHQPGPCNYPSGSWSGYNLVRVLFLRLALQLWQS